MVRKELAKAIKNDETSVRLKFIYKRDKKQFVKNVRILNDTVPFTLRDYKSLKCYMASVEAVKSLDNQIRNAGLKTYAEALQTVRK